MWEVVTLQLETSSGVDGLQLHCMIREPRFMRFRHLACPDQTTALVLSDNSLIVKDINDGGGREKRV